MMGTRAAGTSSNEWECLLCGHWFASPVVEHPGTVELGCPACGATNARNPMGRWYARATSAWTLPVVRVPSGIVVSLAGAPAVRPFQPLRPAELGSRVEVRWRERSRLVWYWLVLLFVPLYLFADELPYATGWSDLALLASCMLVPLVLAYPMLRAGLARTTLRLTCGRVELERPRWPVPRIGPLRWLAATREIVGPARPEDVRLVCHVLTRDGELQAHLGVTVGSVTGHPHVIGHDLTVERGRFLFAVLVGHLGSAMAAFERSESGRNGSSA